MVDINTYLENQMKMNELARSKKDKGKKIIRANSRSPSPIAGHSRQSSSEEYDDEDKDEDYEAPELLKLLERRNLKLIKHKDDGDLKLYNTRIKEWKSNKKKSEDSENTQELITDDFHELAGGLKIPNIIWKKLYRYQKSGVKWLWELHQIESGGLLGDEMGLGKTVQVIAFLAGLSFTGKGFWNGLGPSLIVVPATVIHQWVMHFHHWWPLIRVAALHQSGSFVGTPDKLIRDIHNAHGVLVTTYAGIVKYKSSIELRNWHYVILDEGHKIRNADTQISRAVKKISTSHRIVITGSPLQNNLQELWSLFDFMSPGLLGSLPAFMEHFAIPITQGGYSNATKFQETLALSLAIALKDTISPYMLRRTKNDVKDHLKLPEKSEQVLFCSMSDEQKDLYKGYLVSDTVRSILDKENRYGDPIRARILVALTTLRKICNHPDLFIYEVEDDIPDDENHPLVQAFGFWRRAGKMIVINSLLKIWKKQGHRALIFTQSRAMICILEQFLQQNDYKYLKMDGSTSIGTRQPLISTFNSDNSYLVFLATTRVGGLGVNLTGADRVIIYDPDWNPATDSQAKERAWRIGQLRNVTVYRLLSAGTIEEKIYQRQVFKQLLSNKVLLDPNQKNYLKTSTLQGLFSLEEPDKGGATETTNIFKHTKIDPIKKEDKDSVLLSGGVSFSNDKMEAMRRLAQKISKSLNANVLKDEPKAVEVEDPRERYKRKMLEPPPLPTPTPEEIIPVNKIDDQETKLDFSTALSEIDIVNMCSKPISQTIFQPEHIVEDVVDIKQEIVPVATENEPSNQEDVHHKRKKRKRKSECTTNESVIESDKIEFLESVKRVKEKRSKHKEPEGVQEDQDAYVLEKLFAKSGVQSALQHDKVIGLAEGEERRRLKSEAQEKALRALKALKKSRIRNWRY